MATDSDSRYLMQEREFSVGHYARFRFTVQNFPTKPAWKFRQKYHTRCKSLPTSWEFIIKAEKGRSDCFVSLSRLDHACQPIDAYIWVSCFDIHNRRLSCPEIFCKTKFLPYFKAEDCLPDMIPSEEMRILAQQKLILEVSVSISFCHVKIEPPVAEMSSDLRKITFSKL